MLATGIRFAALVVALSAASVSSAAADSRFSTQRSNGADTVAAQLSAANDDDGDGLSNAWERQWRVSDPERVDADFDGVWDGAEDPDHDGLSNLGEQRVGTIPTRSDTDHDGADDAHDDADGNGIRDGRDQDRRSLPSNLSPGLDEAHWDGPVSVKHGCRTDPGETQIHPCVYGDRGAAVTVVLFGDSHALQWEPALVRAAKRTHWRLVVLSKSGCPSVDVRIASVLFPGDVEPCREWRARAIAWIDAHPVDLVLISNTRAYIVVDSNGHRTDANTEWKAGLRRTLAQLPPGTARLILADTVRFSDSPLPCLRKHERNMVACEISRADASRASRDAVEMAVAAAENGSFVSLNRFVCPYDPCPLVMGNVMMWRDDSHLTATFVRTLWRDVQHVVSQALF